MRVTGPQLVDRRGFLGRGGALFVLAAASTASACDALSTTPEGSESDDSGREKGREAPEFAALVKDGDLPPVEERLPEQPMVVEPVDRVGTYGGEWRMGLVGGAVLTHIVRFQAYEPLVRWTPDWADEPIPNVAESIEISDDGTQFTFRLRRGIKWSDGEPFTADDIMFWYDDVISNPDLAEPPSWMVVNQEAGTVEKVDDHTVVFSFADRHGLFLQRLAAPGGEAPVSYPRHYLEKFHPTYNTEDLDALVEEAGVSDWVQLFQNKGGIDDAEIRWRAEGLPVLHAWRFTTIPGDTTTRAIAERNPYYWKVDPDGSQLPYLDRVVYNFIEGDAVDPLILQILNGEIDLEDQFFATPENKSVLARGREEGDFRFFTTLPTETNEAVIQLNLNHKDPVKREIFNNLDFRIGLSHAIDRNEIIKLVFYGQGEPYQSAPRPDSDHYNEQLARQYTEFDLDLANEHLDRTGYTERDGDGFRLGPDGKRISIRFDIDNARLTFVDLMELVRGYWAEVGIHVNVQAMNRSLWEVRVRESADFDATVHRFGGGAGPVVLLDPRYYFPYDGNSVYAAAWQAWYNDLSPDDVETGVEEPPAIVRQQMELYDRVKATIDTEEKNELMREILQIAADQFYVIGITLQANGYGIVKNNFRNVPEEMPWSYVYPHPGPTNPEQYFVADSAG